MAPSIQPGALAKWQPPTSVLTLCVRHTYLFGGHPTCPAKHPLFPARWATRARPEGSEPSNLFCEIAGEGTTTGTAGCSTLSGLYRDSPPLPISWHVIGPGATHSQGNFLDGSFDDETGGGHDYGLNLPSSRTATECQVREGPTALASSENGRAPARGLPCFLTLHRSYSDFFPSCWRASSSSLVLGSNAWPVRGLPSRPCSSMAGGTPRTSRCSSPA